MTGLHTEITLSFMVPGHTKFSPDWCFGLLKKRYRRTKVDGLSDLVRVVNESAAVNIAQPTALEDGSVVVKTYDWQEYFTTYCTKVPGIMKLHHIRFDAAHPGYIFVKEKSGSTKEKRCILKDKSWLPTAEQLPPVLSPSGLALQWKWYLHDRIREYVDEAFKDITCPKPDQPLVQPPVPPPSSPPNPPTATPPELEQPSGPPPPKRARLCGLCRQPGHNAVPRSKPVILLSLYHYYYFYYNTHTHLCRFLLPCSYLTLLGRHRKHYTSTPCRGWYSCFKHEVRNRPQTHINSYKRMP